MKIIQPLTITDAIFTSSTVPETDEDEWAVGTTYTIADVVMETASGVHKIYTCMRGSTGDYPPDNPYSIDSDDVETGYWREDSATNKWKMFDNKSKSATVQNASIAIVISPSAIVNAIAMVNVVADSVTVQMTNGTVDGLGLLDTIEMIEALELGSDVVYAETFDMVDLGDIEFYYDWFFTDISNKDTLLSLDLAAYSEGVITIELENGTDDVEIGEIVLGKVKNIGTMVYESYIGIEDYSIKEVDSDTGIASITEGVFAKTVDYNVSIESNQAYNIQKAIGTYRATPLIWIGEEDTPESIIFGFMKDFQIILQNLNRSECNIEVEELTS